MTTPNPITPPPELRRQWLDNDHFSMVTGTHDLMSITRDRLNSVMDQAAQWGADQELEACLKALDAVWDDPANSTVEELQRAIRADRRPKLLSLKEQALASLAELESPGRCDEPGYESLYNTIRLALEALDD
jgi:hypothetical protein